MKRIHFFATRDDLDAIIDFVEDRQKLKYILIDHFLHEKYGDKIPIYESAKNIVDLGIAAKNQTGSCERYLVVGRDVAVTPRTELYGSNLPGGGRRITSYDPGDCLEGVEFNAGGFWHDGTLINGLIQTWSDDPAAQKLMRQFASAIKKHFPVKINVFWVGPKALEYLENGGRLTQSVAAGPEFDLKLPNT
ncbi:MULTISPECIES: hypothetical protein [Burkholderia]|uniref:hypothetical protein n=1 Tax=Burkholderia TaxID=32008 RepID=UPI0005B73613|nr:MULTISPECIES: hypothetical protein [Burkholderia]KIP17088.1 hypothetical protein KY49_6858 [Burkholderia sp. MSHR3999]